MIKKFSPLLLLCCFGSISLGAIAQNSAQNSVESAERTPEVQSLSATDVDIGVVFPYSPILATAKLSNIGDKPVRVDRIVPRWAADAAELKFLPRALRAGESMDIGVALEGDSRVGRFSRIYFAYSGEQELPVGKIAIRGFVDWIVDPASTEIDIGIWRVGAKNERVAKVSSRPGTDVKLKRILRPATTVEAAITQEGSSIRFSPRQDALWGAFDEVVVVETDNPLQRKVGFRVRGEIRGSIVPSMTSLEFGLIREGDSPQLAFKLNDESGRAISIGEMKVEGADAQVAVGTCLPDVDSCKLVRLTLAPRKVTDIAPRGLLSIEFPDYSTRLPIPFGGAMIGKDTVIRDFAKEMEAAQAAPGAVSSLLRAAVQTVEPLEMPVPEGAGPLLKWEVKNEATIYGYEVYRSQNATSGFTRMRGIVGKLSNTVDSGSVYRWRDTEAETGQEYWYYIGVVHSDGRKEKLSSPQKLVSK